MISLRGRRRGHWYLYAAVVFLYACAALQVIRYYCKSTIFYLNVNAYLSGTERLPFQKRVLPAGLMWMIQHSRWFAKLGRSNTVLTPQLGAFYLISLFAFIAAAIYAQKLYDAVSEHHTLPLLVFPTLLFTVIWTYCIHLEANYSYPYDMLSLAFFTAGLYYIYRRRYFPLLLVLLIGTLNRETTLFLIVIYILDAASKDGARGAYLRQFRWRQVPWIRVLVLVAIWSGIELALAHRFAHNDRSEDYVRIVENLGRLRPRMIPALLNICGYSIPLVLLFHRSLRPQRYANYLWVFPVWFGVMFYAGVIIETRIYGELCSFSSVALVLIVEHAASESVTLAAPEAESDPLLAESLTT